jgi:putative ABC transport system ATP-binding protein
MTLMVATHDAMIASRCDRIIRLLDGRIVDDIDVPPASDEQEVLARIGRLDMA